MQYRRKVITQSHWVPCSEDVGKRAKTGVPLDLTRARSRIPDFAANIHKGLCDGRVAQARGCSQSLRLVC